MKAVVHRRYGTPDVLALEDVERPTPGSHEVLVKVHATTVNRTDTGFRQGRPLVVRLWSGLRRPKQQILGTEFAGEVERVGSAVTRFVVGDEVFGVSADRFGAHAEYLCSSDDAPIATKPAGITFDEAAAVCDGVVLALTCLRRADLRAGQRVMIYGASGSIGTAAVQLATDYFGAVVTAVCDTGNVDVVRSLGADTVIDYTRDDYTAEGARYDVIFDAVGKTSFGRCRTSLRPGGTYIAVDFGFLCQNPLLALVTSVFGDKRVVFPIPRYDQQHVVLLRQLIEEGRYRAVIDRRYPLEQVVEATRYVETEQKTGNVVLTITS